MAIAALSPVSMPFYDRYVPIESDWTAVHSSYTETVADDQYVESEDEWSWTHTSYDDSFDYAEPETAPPVPDRNAMWSAVNPGVQQGRSMQDAVVSGTGSGGGGGEVSMSLQRDTVPSDQGVPLSTTSVEISVAGTDISKWEVFPDISPTLDVHLDGVPPGIQTIQVKAFSNGRVVGTLSFTVTVAAKEQPQQAARTAPQETEPTEKAARPPLEAAPFQTAPLAPPSAATVSRIGEGAAAASGVEAPREVDEPPAPAPARTQDGPVLAEAPVIAPRAEESRVAPSNPASQAFVAGQAMAAGQGIEPLVSGESLERKSGAFSVHALREAMAGTSDGRGGRHESSSGSQPDPRGPRDDSPEQGDGFAASARGLPPTDGSPSAASYLRGSGAGSLMEFEGAVDVMAGFQRRDESCVWRGALKSVAGGLTFGGVASVSPLLIGMGAALYQGTSSDGRMAHGDTGAWRTLGGWLG